MSAKKTSSVPIVPPGCGRRSRCCLARAARSRWPCWSWRSFPAAPGPSGGASRNMSRIRAITWLPSSRSRSRRSPNGSAATSVPRPSARPVRPNGRFRPSTTAWRSGFTSAFMLHPWVAKATVTKRAGARVQVDIVYRRPVCMVEVANADQSGGRRLLSCPSMAKAFGFPARIFRRSRRSRILAWPASISGRFSPWDMPGAMPASSMGRRLPRPSCRFGSNSGCIASRRRRRPSVAGRTRADL